MDEDLRSAAERVAALLPHCNRLLEQLQGEFLARYELTAVRYRVLDYLDGAGRDGRSQAALAEELQQAESSVCTLVERMRGDGLIYRHRCKQDRRKRILLLTERGRDLHLRVAHTFGHFTSALLGVLAPDRQASLGQLLSDLAAGLERHVDGAFRPDGKVANAAPNSVPAPHFAAGHLVAEAAGNPIESRPADRPDPTIQSESRE